MINHYKWLDENLDTFWKKVWGKSLDEMWCSGIITAHGDKCSCYRSGWEDAGVPFPHGVAVYFLTYFKEYDVREETHPQHSEYGYDVERWVADLYHSKFKDMLPKIED